jgi:Tetratricopeptide repeat
MTRRGWVIGACMAAIGVTAIVLATHRGNDGAADREAPGDGGSAVPAAVNQQQEVVLPKMSTDPGEAYRQAYAMQTAGEPARAAAAYRYVSEHYPGTSYGRRSLEMLYGMLAVLGETQEACETYVRYRLADLAAAGSKLPAEGAEMDELRARAMLEVAGVCEGGGGKGLARARVLYEGLLERFPESEYAPVARKALGWVQEEIGDESLREAARAEIQGLVAKFEKALNSGDVDGLIALLAPSVDAVRVRVKLRAHFQSQQRDKCSYGVPKVQFGKGMASATGTASVVIGSGTGKPQTKHFAFVKADGVWKLSRL